MKDLLRNFGDFLARTNLFISFAAALSALSANSFFRQEIDIYLCVFIFFSTLFTYNFQRVLGDFQNSTLYGSFSKVFLIFGGLGMLATFWTITVPQILILSFCGILSIAYAYPFIQTQKGILSLRLVPRVKLWIIVIVWSLSVSYVPLQNTGLSSLELSLFTLQQAFFIAALTIPFDIRDLRFDSPDQQTIPQKLGIRRAVSLSQVFLTLSFLCCLLLNQSGSVQIPIFVAYSLSLIGCAVIVQKAHPNNDELYFTILVDGLIIIQALLIILAKNYF